jgi:S1-C subfamily serine protease
VRLVTLVDWIAVAVIALAALNGLRRGLVAGALSLAGLAVGAYVGARLGSELLGDEDTAYTPIVALAGAVGLALLLQGIAAVAGGVVRGSLIAVPPLRVADSALGLLLGAATGVALVWVLGAVALNLPGQTDLRREVQASQILKRINREFPPDRLMDAIARVDPFGSIHGPDAAVGPPDPRLLKAPGVRTAAGSVVRVTGSACGLGIQGSGWIAGPQLVVTNAHVVAGVHDARVDRRDGDSLDATLVAFDPRNDIAVLRVPELEGRPLGLEAARSGVPVAILGYPENGPFTVTPARIGQTTSVITDDAYGRGPVTRTVTTLRGVVQHGNSGGPAVDSRGRVRTTVFAQRVGAEGGYGVPATAVRDALGHASREVPPGPCVR